MSDRPVEAFGNVDRVGAYRLLREVGRGAVGVVYEAHGPQEERVALKLLAPPPGIGTEEVQGFGKRFLREARALAAVDHPNVVRVLDAGEDSGRLFLAMEFLEGENLRQRLTRQGPMEPSEAVAVTVQLCAALEAVHHAGIVHRDVKPENVVIRGDGSIVLTDFGVAWMESEVTLTRTGGVLGSPAYMSPEQVLGRPVDRRSDIYSAAATLYQLLSGRLPFEGSGLLELAQQVAYSDPAPLNLRGHYALERAVLRGLQKSPAARYATAAELAHGLSAATSGAPRRVPAPIAAQAVVAEGTVITPPASCARHPRRPAMGQCQVCSRALCPACAGGSRGPYYCFLHAPVTLFGVSTVRLEVAVAAVAFFLLLLIAGPWGYTVLRR